MTAPSGPHLRDIHLPPPPGWWPPAPGWWLLAALVAAVAVALFMALRRRRHAHLQRRAILRELDRCIEAAGGDPVRLAAALSTYLRRVAMRANPDAGVWHGRRWLEYLDAPLGGEEFRSGIGQVLVDAPYRPIAAYDTVALIALVRRWTRSVLTAGAIAHA